VFLLKIQHISRTVEKSEIQLMADSKRVTDHRAERTRLTLRKAFKEVIAEKGFAATSIQDIADRAQVNRGTFYKHFADKYVLLDVVVRAGFQEHMANALPPAPCWNKATLRLLIRAVLDNLEGKYRHRPRWSPLLIELAPILEHTLREELNALLLSWLCAIDNPSHVPPETTARVVSWAIFGAALQWSQEPVTISAEHMTDDILQVILEGLSPLIPETLSE
jgi:AcrR family transcriptional regulator